MTDSRDVSKSASTAYAADLRVLVAEPDEETRTLYGEILGTWNAGIVDSGSKCIALVSSSASYYDMVIIDSHILENGAFETIHRIKELNPKQHVVITSQNAGRFEEKLKAAGLTGDSDFIIDVVQKPLGISELLSLIRSKIPRISKVRLRDHNLGIYDSSEEEMDEAIAYLKLAMLSNEAAAFIVRKDTDLVALKRRMREAGIDEETALRNGSLFIFRNEEWYLPDSRLDTALITGKWLKLTDKAVQSGRSGLRVFCMMDCFFEHNLASEVVDYEHTFPRRFDIPLASVCAYRKQDIDRLSDDRKQKLVMCHHHVWTNNKD